MWTRTTYFVKACMHSLCSADANTVLWIPRLASDAVWLYGRIHAMRATECSQSLSICAYLAGMLSNCEISWIFTEMNSVSDVQLWGNYSSEKLREYLCSTVPWRSCDVTWQEHEMQIVTYGQLEWHMGKIVPWTSARNSALRSQT